MSAAAGAPVTRPGRTVLVNDQRSTQEQLRDLVQIANQHGLYDAADFITSHLCAERG